MQRRSLLALPMLLATLACGTPGVRVENRVAIATPQDFYQFPGKYRGRTVRLDGVEVARLDATRPLVFLEPGTEDHEIVVVDARGIARRGLVREGELTSIVISCIEGRSDRGNVLRAVLRGGPQATPTPMPAPFQLR